MKEREKKVCTSRSNRLAIVSLGEEKNNTHNTHMYQPKNNKKNVVYYA